MEHHNLDAHPIPKGKMPLFINEPWMIDDSLQWIQQTGYDPAPLSDDDNIRVYIPMDICKSSILRRLDYIIGSRKKQEGRGNVSKKCLPHAAVRCPFTAATRTMNRMDNHPWQVGILTDKMDCLHLVRTCACVTKYVHFWRTGWVGGNTPFLRTMP